jgi:hypothetical protein
MAEPGRWLATSDELLRITRDDAESLDQRQPEIVQVDLPPTPLDARSDPLNS